MRNSWVGIMVLANAGVAFAQDQSYVCYYNSAADFTSAEKAPSSSKVGEVASIGYTGDKVYSYVISARDETSCPNQVPLGAKTAATYPLVRRDASGCTNDDVVATEAPELAGSVTIYRVSSRTGGANLHLVNGTTPDTNYVVFLKCGERLGTMKTDAKGRADRTFNFPLGGPGAAVAFELVPDGADGATLQSVKIVR
jgi:hypothetical protein